MNEDKKHQIVNTVMDILLSHEDKLSDGFFYYLPIDWETETGDMEQEDLQKMTLWRICHEIVDAVTEQL